MSYATISDIQARLPDRISVVSKPTVPQVQEWIGEAEAMLNGALLGAGLPAPYTETAAVLMLRVWICEYVEGRVRMAQAALGGDPANDDGKDLVDKFFARMTDIANNAPRYGSMLASGAAPAESVHVRGSNSDGALEPIFTNGMEW